MRRTILLLLLLGGAFSCTGCQTLGQVAKTAAVEAFEKAKPELVKLGDKAISEGKFLALESLDKALTAGKETAKDAAEIAAVKAATVAGDKIAGAADRLASAAESLPGPIRDAVAKLDDKTRAWVDAKAVEIAAKPEDERTPWERLLLGAIAGATGLGEARKWARDRAKAAPGGEGRS